AHEGIRELIGIQRELLAQLELPAPMSWSPAEADQPLRELVGQLATGRVKEAMLVGEKAERNALLDVIRAEVASQVAQENPEYETAVSPLVKEIEKREMRELILSQGRRSDGRGLDDVRPISIDLS